MTKGLLLSCRTTGKDTPQLRKASCGVSHMFFMLQKTLPDLRAINQPLTWKGGRCDRNAITQYTSANTSDNANILGVDQEQQAALAFAVMRIQCATEFNRPLNIACSHLHELMGLKEDQEITCEAFFIDGGILVFPHDAATSDRYTLSHRTNSELSNPTIGILILRSAETAHETVEAELSKKVAIEILRNQFEDPEFGNVVTITAMMDGDI